jgi:hypothetical protein
MSVEKFLDAGTSYITYEDSLKLLADPDNFPTRVITHEYGWIIHVPPWDYLKEEDNDELVQMLDKGYSHAFVILMVYASKRDCWWINLDSDGGDVEGLPQHEW